MQFDTESDALGAGVSDRPTALKALSEPLLLVSKHASTKPGWSGSNKM